MNQAYQFKIRLHGNNERWEDIPSMTTPKITGREMRLILTSFDYQNKVEEVRYNIEGSLQGCYVNNDTRWENDGI